jgi:PAS domain S-box-containing protein
MTTSEQDTIQASRDGPSRILPLIGDEGNRRVLVEWLDAHDEYTLVETAELSAADFDCCLLDRELLFEYQSELLERKARERIVLPYLLLVPESRHREIRDRLREEYPDLWESIDGLIDMPLAEDRLAEQLETFLRLRSQSISAHQQREQLRRIRNQHAGHGVIITDSEGVIEYVNEAFEAQSGYAREEVIGTNPRILKSGEHEEAFYEELWTTITAGEVWDGTVINERKDGNRYVVEQTIAPVEGPRGAIDQFIAVNHEITELKELESRLRDQREQLDVLNRVLRHDIRNDMNLVLAWGEMLEDDVSADEREQLDRMVRAARHVVELTTLARDLSQLIHGDETLELDEISLWRILGDELEKCRDSFPDAEIAMPAPPEGDTHVLANELLSSVFRNLINNAIQHNDATHPEVVISVEEADESVRVRVADNGPGIPDEMKDSLFGEGEKGLDSEGTGIGLFLVRSLVDSYGGDVWIEDRSESVGPADAAEADHTGAVFVVELRRPTNRDDTEAEVP